jgi:hypothetical protein
MHGKGVISRFLLPMCQLWICSSQVLHNEESQPEITMQIICKLESWMLNFEILNCPSQVLHNEESQPEITMLRRVLPPRAGPYGHDAHCPLKQSWFEKVSLPLLIRRGVVGGVAGLG